jgi:ADP-heptose:LPS heptosyltransferase
MNLITFGEPITVAFRKSAGGSTVTFEAGREYLLANSQIERLLKDENVQRKSYKISKADMRIPNFNVRAAKKGDRVLLYNGSGGYGDQIMTWPVAHLLAKFGFDVHILTDPGNNVCWWNFPWIKTLQTIPILWEQAKMFDHFCIFEAVINMDEHQDQGHPVDVMLNKIGIDPRTVTAEEKLVRPVFTYSETSSLQGFRATERKVGLYQLASANPVRCYPPSDSAFLIQKLAEAFPDTHWLCLYDEFVPKAFAEMLNCRECKGTGLVPAADKGADEKAAKNVQCPTCGGTKYIAKNIEPFCAPNLRELWALTEHVSVVVSPDSMMVHVAGAFGTPCVGMWGPVAPERRTCYYKGHHPIFHREFCPHCPCFVYSAAFPKYCPPRPSTRTTCDVLAGISPEEVIEMVKKVRR